MGQMYKVFIKESLLILSDQPSDEAVNYLGEAQLDNLISSMLNEEKREVYLLVKDAAEAWSQFKAKFKIIEAAGGAVINPNGQILMIYRLGKWDLPKGKIEFGEPKEMAAVREVEEETGVSKPEIVGVLPTTYHVYELEGKQILKRTYWYTMAIAHDFDFLVPQLEEAILDAVWCDRHEVEENLKNTHGNIKLVLDAMVKGEY